jgi:hypothetical protein
MAMEKRAALLSANDLKYKKDILKKNGKPN